MIIGDPRPAAKQLNEYLASLANQRRSPRFEGEVAYFPKVFVFGHYDSRGGATAIVAPNAIAAMQHYIEAYIALDIPENERSTFIDIAYEDLLQGGMFEFIFIGEAPTPDTDILATYAKGGFEFARLETSYARGPRPPANDEHWFPTQVVVGWRVADDAEPRDEGTVIENGPPMKSNQETVHYQMRLWDPGEDAYGLIWQVANVLRED